MVLLCVYAKEVSTEPGGSWQYDLHKDQPRELRAALRRPGGMFAVAKVIEPAVADYYLLQDDDFRDLDACKTQSWWDLVEGLAVGVLGSKAKTADFLKSFQEPSRKSAVKSSMARAVR